MRGSSEAAKRDFLVGKGLTESEIDEAFRRVPVVDEQKPQEGLNQIQGSPQNGGGAPALVSQEPKFSWTNILLGLGFTAAAAYSIKSIFGPSIQKKYRAWKDAIKSRADGCGENVEQETLASAIREQTEQMRVSLESLQRLIEMQSESKVSDQVLSELKAEVQSLSQRLDQGSRSINHTGEA